eukprot:CCRYP_001205-RA/>CCRYP_001205-RA protein AED:0.56 eAED:0.51 QI:0/0/0/0.5/0/0/2/0/161
MKSDHYHKRISNKMAPTNTCLQALPLTATLPTTTRHQHYAIFDSGATAHFLVDKAHVVNKRPALKPLTIRLPNGKHIVSTHTCNLIFPWHSITEAHIVRGYPISHLHTRNSAQDARSHLTSIHARFTKEPWYSLVQEMRQLDCGKSLSTHTGHLTLANTPS